MVSRNQHLHVLPDQLPHPPQRAATNVHLIAPEDETGDLDEHEQWPNNGHSSSSSAPDGDSLFLFQSVTALQDAGSLLVQVAGSVIQREAASVNQRLLQVQDRLHRQKRRRLDTSGESRDSSSSIDIDPTRPDRTASPLPLQQQDTTSTSTATRSTDAHTAVSEKESISIWNQAARTKRMSILLRDLEMTHSLLLREIAAASLASDTANACP
jgi:hypothetical protein